MTCEGGEGKRYRWKTRGRLISAYSAGGTEQQGDGDGHRLARGENSGDAMSSLESVTDNVMG